MRIVTVYPKIPIMFVHVAILVVLNVWIGCASGRLIPPPDFDFDQAETRTLFAPRQIRPLPSPPVKGETGDRVLVRKARGAASALPHGDFSGVAKMSTFASLGTYGGFLGHSGDTSGGYQAGSGRNGLGGITISGALGSYGGYLGHKGPINLSSGGYGSGGLLFGKDKK